MYIESKNHLYLENRMVGKKIYEKNGTILFLIIKPHVFSILVTVDIESLNLIILNHKLAIHPVLNDRV